MLRHILAVDDFQTFKALMVKRNLELNEEALRMWALKEKAEAAMVENGVRSSEPEYVDGDAEDLEGVDEEELLRRAIRMSEEEHKRLLSQGKSLESMAEEQLQQAMHRSAAEVEAARAAQAREDAELEMAIAMSLALDDERRKMDEAVRRAEAESAQDAAKRAAAEEARLAARAREEAALREAAARAAADKSAKDSAALAKMEEDRIKKEAELARRAESARKIMDELREAKQASEAEKPKTRRPPPAAPTAGASSSAAANPNKDVEEELRIRQAFLKKTRDDLVARKAKERNEEARRYQELHGVAPDVTAPALNPSESQADLERVKMRLALGQRLKVDMIEDERKKGGTTAAAEADVAAQRKVVEGQSDARKRAQEEAKLAELERELERKRALDKVHSNLKPAHASDEFAFNE